MSLLLVKPFTREKYSMNKKRQKATEKWSREIVITDCTGRQRVAKRQLLLSSTRRTCRTHSSQTTHSHCVPPARMGAGCTRCIVATSSPEALPLQDEGQAVRRGVAVPVIHRRNVKKNLIPVLDEIARNALEKRRGRELDLEIGSQTQSQAAESRSSSVFSRDSTPPRNSSANSNRPKERPEESSRSTSGKSPVSHFTARSESDDESGSRARNRIAVVNRERMQALKLKPLPGKDEKTSTVAVPTVTRSASSSSAAAKDAIFDDAIKLSRSTPPVDAASTPKDPMSSSCSSSFSSLSSHKLPSALWLRRYGKRASHGEGGLPTPPPSFLRVPYLPKD